MVEIFKLFKVEMAWIGGTDLGQERKWRWVDGSKFAWTKWHSGEPNNSGGDEHCMQFLGTAWNQVKNNWNDVACHRKYMAVCKIGPGTLTGF